MEMTSLYKSLEHMDNIFGVSNDEGEVAAALKEEMAGLYDDFFEDAIGNQYYIKKGKDQNRTIAFSAHMDEIGFIVSYIEDNGILRFLPVGFHDDRNAVNQEMVINTHSGKKIYGVTGAIAPHSLPEEDRMKVTRIQDLFLDIGTESKEETLALGVQIGDYIGYCKTGHILNDGDYYMGKSLDDRCGLAVMIECLKRLKDYQPECNVCMIGSVQEEVGSRAGGPIAHNIEPEMFIAIDVTVTGDIPGLDPHECQMMSGKGPCVKLYDWRTDDSGGNLSSRKVVDAIINSAEKYNIPYQREIMLGGGTDAENVSVAGKSFLTGGISVPERYVHTAVGTLSMKDLKNTTALTEAFIREYK